MGLDTVEFIIEVEERFQIVIDDEDAQYLGIVGDLARYVADKTRHSEQEYSLEQVLTIIIKLLVENYAVPEGKTNSQSHFVHDLELD